MAAFVLALKLVVGLEDSSAEKHNALCSQRLCDQAQDPTSDHRHRRVCHLLMLRPFCKHQFFYHVPLFQLLRVVDPTQNYNVVFQVRARFFRYERGSSDTSEFQLERKAYFLLERDECASSLNNTNQCMSEVEQEFHFSRFAKNNACCDFSPSRFEGQNSQIGKRESQRYFG